MQHVDHHASGSHARDVRWQVTTRTGVTFVCRVCVIDGIMEVRLTTSDVTVCATRVSALDDATAVARRWLHAVLQDQSMSESLLGERIDVVH